MRARCINKMGCGRGSVANRILRVRNAPKDGARRGMNRVALVYRQAGMEVQAPRPGLIVEVDRGYGAGLSVGHGLASKSQPATATQVNSAIAVLIIQGSETTQAILKRVGGD